MKIVFMGTPDYAVGALRKIVEAGHQVAAVVTQPDKPKGRGKEMQMTPVKACALQYGLSVFQPVKIKTPEAVEKLQSYGADIFVVAAFGQILSEEILQMPKYGCINIHASLLPKYRGAGPIQWAILNGEKETGITIMQMDKGIDTGDILLQSVVPIDEKETGDSLHDKLADVGAELIVEALVRIEAGEVTPHKQKEEDSCYAKMLQKAMGKIDWQQETVQIERMVRGLNSWPSAYTSYLGKTLKIWESSVSGDKAASNDAPGTITMVEKDAFYVRTGDGTLKITQVQLEGKKRMSVKDFLLGYSVKIGDMLG
ncbi:MAG: methionyl-tRNA formyltransferase [Blautia sp.]|nr:methionyl-tRNA formyltransferase [Lachnoclostridium sp.]MCM1210468.1 methionyl-tRNA formyltransferase [Blautia sp.]